MRMENNGGFVQMALIPPADDLSGTSHRMAGFGGRIRGVLPCGRP